MLQSGSVRLSLATMSSMLVTHPLVVALRTARANGSFKLASRWRLLIWPLSGRREASSKSLAQANWLGSRSSTSSALPPGPFVPSLEPPPSSAQLGRQISAPAARIKVEVFMLCCSENFRVRVVGLVGKSDTHTYMVHQGPFFDLDVRLVQSGRIPKGRFWHSSRNRGQFAQTAGDPVAELSRPAARIRSKSTDF